MTNNINMSDKSLEEQIEYYVNLDWTTIEGTDYGFDKDLYHYLEIKEFPSFAYCAKTAEIVKANYKKQLRLLLRIMLEDGDKIPNPGDDPEEIN